ncbi:MAG: ATP-binding protein [Terracidiphilus sp.]|jgi:two-component system sensor histidine kinase KdpD
MANSIVLGWTHAPRGLRVLGQSLAAFAGLALLTYGGLVLRVNLTTISFLYLLLVVGLALFCGFWQASLASFVAAACLDYFFTQPLFHFYIADPQDWVALGAFQVTALVISRLSAKELRSAREAAIHRTAMEQLYELSRNSILLDLRQPPGPQLVVLIQRIFNVRAVALFDVSLGREDRAGDWNEGEEHLAKQCYLRGSAKDDPLTRTSERILVAGPGPVGALVVRGKLSPLVVDALASLAAIAIDRHQSFEKEDRAETASKGEQLRAAVMDALAHEFKTPLTAVQTASSGLLELGGLSDSQRDLVTLIDNEAVRMNELCTRLLLTAKLEADKVDLQTDEVNVQELVLEVLAGRPAERDRNRMQVAVDDPALTVRVDRGLLAMILAQYIDNARKYSTPDTPIEIAARMSHSEVLISVHNFGPTIRIEDRERIFDRFYRSPEMKDSIPGTGVGLSVVRKAAEAHHGHVWVISDDKEGTTFFLSLPKGARRKH